MKEFNDIDLIEEEEEESEDLYFTTLMIKSIVQKYFEKKYKIKLDENACSYSVDLNEKTRVITFDIEFSQNTSCKGTFYIINFIESEYVERTYKNRYDDEGEINLDGNIYDEYGRLIGSLADESLFHTYNIRIKNSRGNDFSYLFKQK